MKNGKLLLLLNIIILILLSINLYVMLGMRSEIRSKDSSNENPTKSILSILSEQELTSVVQELTSYTNNSDFISVYAMFSDWTKNQVSENDLEDTVIKIGKLTGKVNKFYYSYNEYLGFSEGADWFNVFFKSDFENGPGTIRISFRIIDGKNEITGFKYNIDDIQ